jgi:hypothetical protein
MSFRCRAELAIFRECSVARRVARHPAFARQVFFANGLKHGGGGSLQFLPLLFRCPALLPLLLHRVGAAFDIADQFFFASRFASSIVRPALFPSIRAGHDFRRFTP